MITAGVDVGAKYVKLVLLEDGKNVLKRANGIVGFDVWKSTTEVFEKALVDIRGRVHQHILGQVNPCIA